MAGGLPAVMARGVPGPAAIPAGAVASAEVAAAEVVRRVQPTDASERRRAEVIDYARRIIGTALGCEVFVFGSVPLKTYLPDGDIDLTVIGNTSCDSTLIDDIYYILGSVKQDTDTDAEFEVKDLEHIDAEVRLIKCTIGNIIVDISFNQTGGICALCFLELVDRKVGKNHLFKRSIILIKAWCYYESRLLGAHHGLISTYALETLILYIFNLFHKSLHGPLEVLYRFLEYFSKFDWDNYCISLNGPVAVSSLPNLIVEGTDVPCDDLLFDQEFLEDSMENTFVPPRNFDVRCTKFRVKHLNIIDPLKECNNLGRSVNRANFNRIRTAFSFGARKLGQILMLRPELIPGDIFLFFKNTLERNESGVRADISHGAFHCQHFLDSSKQLVDDMSCMQISYKQGQNLSPLCVPKSFAKNRASVKINVPTQGECFSGYGSLAPSTDISARSSYCFHDERKKHSYASRGYKNGVREQYFVDHEMEGQVSRYTAEASMDDKSLTPPLIHANYSPHIMNSTNSSHLGLPKPDPVNKEILNGISLHVEKHHLPPLSLLNLPDLSGDLESQLRCLRQVQYNLEYLFDDFLQSVKEASSDGQVDMDLFDILNSSILLSTDMTLPGLMLPSYTETDGRKLSPVSSHSTEVSQQSQDEDHWGAAFYLNAFGIDVQCNGLSPSPYFADSDISVPWCHSSEAVPTMYGTGLYTREKHMASIGEKGKTPINQPVKIKDNHAAVPKRSFVPYEEQVAPDSVTNEIRMSQPLRTDDGLNGYTCSGRKTIEKHSGHARKECVKPHDEARHVRRYHGDVCSNKSFFQKRNYDTSMESVQQASARHQPPGVTTDACTYINNISSRMQIYDTRKGHDILNKSTNRRPTCEPLKPQSSLQSRGFSKKSVATKQNCDNRSDHLSSVRGTRHQLNGQVVNIPNGVTKEVEPDKKLVENGSKPRPSLTNILVPHDSGNSQRIRSTSRPYFPVTKGYSQPGASDTQPDRIIEFGSLGPFSLTSPSPKPNKAPSTHSSGKASADASASALQSYRAGSIQSRSSGAYRIGDEDEFPPLHAK